MTLTVPTAGVSGGRSAQLQFEAPQTGAVLEQFGNVMKGVGDKLESQRLNLEMSKLQLGMTRDMDQLRLKYQNVGDPDQIDAGWAADINALKASYFDGKTETGRARVDPKIRDQFGLMFDDLSEKHAFALGTQALAMRHSQTIATGIEYRNEIVKQASVADAATRDTLYEQGAEGIDREVAQGIKSPEQGANEKIALREGIEKNAAGYMLQDDPQGLLETLDAGELSSLSAEDRVAFSDHAKGEIARREKAASEKAVADNKEQVAGWKKQITDGIGVVEKGGRWADAAVLDNPEIAAALPDEVAQARGAISLQNDGKNVNSMTLDDLKAERDTLKGKAVSKPWQTDRLTYLNARIDTVEKGLATDPSALWQKSMPDILPPLDLSDPQKAAAGLVGRIARTDHLVATKHMAKAAYLSDAEKAALKPLLAPEAATDDRMAWVQALVSADPAKAATIAAAVGGSKALQQSIELLADGIDPNIVRPILNGEAKIAAGVASAPASKNSQMLFGDVTGGAFANDPQGGAKVKAAADALFADAAGGIDPDETSDVWGPDGPARQKYTDAIQEVTGATRDADGNFTIGGVQEIRGRRIPLPRGVPADDFSRALDLVGEQLAGGDVFGENSNAGMTLLPAPDAGPKADLPKVDPYRGLKAASLRAGAYPDFGANGADPASTFEGVRVEPAGGVGQDAYVFVRTTDRGIDRIVTDQNGQEFYFSASGLIKQVPR